jgi:tRNA(Ile)-lysidine synthase
MDDQAETFLMRLGREAGVDGLAAMSARWRQGEVEFCRPALRVSRGELRSVLRSRGIEWIDDPTNEDMAYDRTRARRALESLAGLGITPRVLSNVAHHMSDVREALYWYVFLAARELVSFQSGDILIARKGFRTLQREIARRLVQEALKWVGGAEYPPRGRALELLMESIRGGAGMTLHGCIITISRDTIRISREAQAVEGLRCGADECWDGRWRLSGPWPEGAEVAMLGEAGLAECREWRETGLPAASLRASPAVWRDGILLAAPLAGLSNGWRAELTRDEDHFFAALLSH